MNWIMLAVLLMIPGAAGLGWGQWQHRRVAHRSAEAAEAVADAPSADEYLAMYEQWAQLSADEKTQTPWGHDPYGGPDIQRRLRQDRHTRFQADLPELDAGLKSYPPQLADVLYGADWQRQLADYQKQRDTVERIKIAASIVLVAGGLLFVGGLSKALVLLALRKKIAAVWDDPKSEQSPAVKAAATTAQHQPTPSDNSAPDAEADTGAEPDADSDEDARPAAAQDRGYFGSSQKSRPAPDHTQAFAMPDNVAAQLSVLDPEADGKSYFGWAMDSETDPQPVTTLMTTHPVSHGLSELTEEVSAIRQYAAAQQDQMRKLQDGYDWMIIRRFCMRIIRCIDNLDDRIARLQEETLATYLNDIRDELIFALESSGIEQYQPDLEAPFKGLEKYAEAVRPRVPVDDAAKIGLIAEIVRPGYQYLISDDDVKIVRCAQVKLYCAAQTEG